jgi:hypothetical protein
VLQYILERNQFLWLRFFEPLPEYFLGFASANWRTLYELFIRSAASLQQTRLKQNNKRSCFKIGIVDSIPKG